MLSTGTGQRKIAKIATVSKFATGMFGDLGGLADHVPLDLDRHFLFKKKLEPGIVSFYRTGIAGGRESRGS